MPPHPLTDFEIQKYYQNESKFNGVYSKNNLPKINDRACVINLDEYKPMGTHYIVLYVSDNNVTYFHRFGVEHDQKKLENSLKIKMLKQRFIEYKHMIQ